ncbi:anaerobic ribonucleoside-triphosphate reductase activating protein [Marinitoga aeolica]|uniref:Anaerobic ribonucleoside-triphosphate reductase activating protein n=1 Tax=Marinitoga aeolica TaxID=2809031 RepID=A0ABY8PQ00_9BACT|nr:anaerobic ribonucleoside-triphosphate reductase activating protein [Marinitoga aeolica]WGS64713.1 anaerobic ribonucleoside-triphosphate reductase activating protein [Marinitoga aeolica]
MVLAGIRTFSFVDYPKRISAVVYTGGCNFRCQWCHNWKIAYSNEYNVISEGKILKKLKDLKKRLNAVCVTGGEPTIHNDLPEFISKIKEMGYLIKLDTNGTNPDMVSELIENKLIDYVAMDIKAKPENYYKLINIPKKYWDNINKTIEILRNSNVDYEFRMTYVSGLSTEEDVEFFENMLLENEKGYITMANSTEIFEVNSKDEIRFNKLILR